MRIDCGIRVQSALWTRVLEKRSPHTSNRPDQRDGTGRSEVGRARRAGERAWSDEVRATDAIKTAVSRR